MLPKLTASSALGFLTLTANASQLLRLDVDQDADAYEVHVVMELNAPPETVRAILTDYANLDRLNGSITASKVLGSEPVHVNITKPLKTGIARHPAAK